MSGRYFDTDHNDDRSSKTDRHHSRSHHHRSRHDDEDDGRKYDRKEKSSHRSRERSRERDERKYQDKESKDYKRAGNDYHKRENRPYESKSNRSSRFEIEKEEQTPRSHYHRKEKEKSDESYQRYEKRPKPNSDFDTKESKINFNDQTEQAADIEKAALEALTKEALPLESEPTSDRFDRPRNMKKNENKSPVEKEKINFGTSGKLAEDTNTFNGVVVNYTEPEEAKKPNKKWRLYPFKGDEALSHIEINKQSAFLLGRDRRVVDIPIDHPSCSKQHAAIQFRLMAYEKEDGSQGKRIRPYMMDLGSANGSYINNERIEPRRYYELMEKDVIKFGFSSREYVVLTDQTKN